MDGMECTRQIRRGIEGIDAKLPIILLTGMVSEEAKAAAYAAVECIQFEGAHFRRDIAAKALVV